MVQIFMELNNPDRLVPMEKLESFNEAVHRCKLYYKRNPKNYYILVDDEYLYAKDYF